MTKKDAIKWAGGVVLLAERLGITPGAVSQWIEVPELQQYKLWTLSAGALVVDPKLRVKAKESK